jgi:predicted  nucleic acid-binding Zn-ribbon protein
MPHKCTRCDTIFEDGAVEILNGCPNCGWNKFLYVRDVTEDETEKKEDQSEKKILKEIDEFIQEHGIKTDEIEKVEQEPESERIESLRIMGPGSYELNLEALLEREEIILALKEDGKYVVHLPSVFDTKKKKKK